MSSFAIYLIGYIILIIGLTIAAVQLGVPQIWIVVGVIVMIGIAVLSGVSHTKRRDPPDPPSA